MTKLKTKFNYHRVDVGLDVHKRSWNAAVFLDEVYVRNIDQPPSPKALHSFLTSPVLTTGVHTSVASLASGYNGNLQT